jgi:8-oxo-dGTP pyrophosphatase MutT (NUDIX family)
MPILAQTTVMPELLPVTYARLRAEIEGVVAERERNAVLQAGGIVILADRGVVALRRGRDGGVALPKGHREPGETLAETAIREVREETGIHPTIVGWLGASEFHYPPGDDDAPLHYSALFVMTGAPTDALSDHLASDTMLVPVSEAASRISVPSLRVLVQHASPTLARLSDKP